MKTFAYVKSSAFHPGLITKTWHIHNVNKIILDKKLKVREPMLVT